MLVKDLRHSTNLWNGLMNDKGEEVIICQEDMDKK